MLHKIKKVSQIIKFDSIYINIHNIETNLYNKNIIKRKEFIMVGKVLKILGWQNKIDLSPAGLDDLKVMLLLLGIMLGIFVGLVIPWLYGLLQIGLLIFK